MRVFEVHSWGFIVTYKLIELVFIVVTRGCSLRLEDFWSTMWMQSAREGGAYDSRKLNVKNIRIDHVPWICRRHCWPNWVVKIMVMKLDFWNHLYFGSISLKKRKLFTFIYLVVIGSEKNSIWGPPQLAKILTFEHMWKINADNSTTLFDL